jgi:hypothetical protein
MEILKKSGDYNIVINQENDFLTNLGWQEGMDIFEEEVLDTIINPIDNYETVRYIHEPYSGLTSNSGDTQCDIWFKFYFIDSVGTYTNGLDYSLVGIAPKDNAKMLKTTTESYFRLEFFKTPNNEAPTRINRKLVFSKNLSLPLGEKFYYNPLRQNIHIPVFMGSNYRNKENMYLFWFQDDTVLSDSTLSGNTFYMTAKFLNATDGSVLDFTTRGLSAGQQLVEYRDMYYKIVINKTNYTYKVYDYDGGTTTESDLVGKGINNAIKFYEKGGTIATTPAATLSPTPAPTLSPTPAPTLSPTPQPTSGGGGGGSPAYSVSVNSTSINETSPNNVLIVTVTTTNVANGTVLYWGLTVGSSIVLSNPPSSDFTGDTYSLTINNNQGSFTLTAVEDFRTEGPTASETFAIDIKTGNTSGTIVATTQLISLNDTSKDPQTFTYYNVKNCSTGTSGFVMRYPGNDDLSTGVVYVKVNPTFNPDQASYIYKILSVNTGTEFTLYYGGEESAPEGGC